MSLSKEKSIISDRKATTNSGDTSLISTFWPGLRLCLWLETASQHYFIVTDAKRPQQHSHAVGVRDALKFLS